MHGGPSPGAPKGNQNAYKHGRYSTQTKLKERQIAALIREMRATAADGGAVTMLRNFPCPRLLVAKQCPRGLGQSTMRILGIVVLGATLAGCGVVARMEEPPLAW